MHQTDSSPDPIDFTPLHACDPNCLLGFRSDARASELYDEATLR